ncbi:carboxymuconolactone decarboxylase family protein [Methylonatrum kenyense]|uniref:carboxymuconolactone decarboxylase family protein n=1 Tax=Methylonatrum kenyense TaxID=455253 RepID=UPI0020BE5BDA|nr:carboxymuconolactone decarboxylase family protein [Methylonatrum kenyense]MCK8516408.1 carboxymuconolactone decarboxylase family protein [Methylonatrum kenyense]
MRDELPASAGDLAEDYPEVWEAYAALGESCADAGPLDERERRLVKLALAVALGSEGATHSHARQALEAGLDPEDIRHVALLAVTTLGFPRAVAALTWIDDVLDGDEESDEDG